eukprot:365808_1
MAANVEKRMANVQIQYSRGSGYNSKFETAKKLIQRRFPYHCTIVGKKDDDETDNFEITVNGILVHSKKSGNNGFLSVCNAEEEYVVCKAIATAINGSAIEDGKEYIEQSDSIELWLQQLELSINNGCQNIPKKIFFPDFYTEYDENITTKYAACITNIKIHLTNSLKAAQAIHPYYVWALSRYLEDGHEQEQSEWENKLYQYGSKLLFKGDKMSTNEKHLIKMCLAWVPKVSFNYETLLKWKDIAASTLGILAKPLQVEYNAISAVDNIDGNRLVNLTLDGVYKYDYKSRNITQEWVIPRHEWRNPHSGFNMSAKEIIASQKQLKQLGLNDYRILKKCVYDDFVYDTVEQCPIDYDDFYREYIRAIACKINGGFQNVMNELFTLNRTNLKLNLNSGEMDKDLGHSEAAVKSISRVLNKESDYEEYEKPSAQYILDWVRCGIVIEDANELLNLYELILERFKGNIIRIKNGFGKDITPSYGYRAILMNLIYEHECGLQMICEVQLILLSYLKVRKRMHLYYKIARVECDENSFDADIGAQLAGDFSKFADMDVVS